MQLKNLPTKKTWIPDGFTSEFYYNVKKEIVLILQNPSRKKIKFYEASITLISKTDKNFTR